MKQRNTGLHVGKYRKNRTFSSRLTETILPSALIFCALAGLLTTVTGLTAILSLFASGLIFLPCSRRSSISAKRPSCCPPRSCSLL